MRILMLTQFYAPTVGGEERIIQTLSASLVRRGHHVAVATIQHPGLAPTEVIDGVRVYRLPGLAARVGRLFSESGRRHAPPVPDPETVIALRRVLAHERPDVVHGHNWLTHAYLPLSRRSSAAYVLSLHDYSLICATKRLMRREQVCSGPGLAKCAMCAADRFGAAVGPAVALLTAFSARAELRAVDLFLPVSHAVARHCGLEERGVRYEVVPNFTSEAVTAASEESPPGLPDGPFLLFVGDVVADKGVGVLVEAQSRMATPLPLVLIGRLVHPELVPARKDVIHLGLLPHPAVLAAWRRCAVGVVPSILPEPFGLVVIEAMSTGTPVIASRTGGLQDIVEDGISGLLTTPGDVQELRDALDLLAGDPALRQRLGQGAAERATHYTPDQVLPRFEAAYDRALELRRLRVAA